MLRVIYRWKVKNGQEEAFADAWAKATKSIRMNAPGARGSLLLRSRRDPAEFVAIARWESAEAWTSARMPGRPAADPEAQKIMHDTAGDVISAEFYDELHDLTDTST